MSFRSLHTFCRRNIWPGACDAAAVPVVEHRREAFQRGLCMWLFLEPISARLGMHLGRRRDVICLLLTAAATTRRRRLRRMCFLTTFGRSPPHLRHPFSHKQHYVVIIIHEGKYPLETRNGFYFIIVDYTGSALNHYVEVTGKKPAKDLIDTCWLTRLCALEQPVARKRTSKNLFRCRIPVCVCVCVCVLHWLLCLYWLYKCGAATANDKGAVVFLLVLYCPAEQYYNNE